MAMDIPARFRVPLGRDRACPPPYIASPWQWSGDDRRLRVSFPLRTIFAAYGGAALLACAGWILGLSFLPGFLVFWLGGAIGLIAVALLKLALRGAFGGTRPRGQPS